MAELREPRRARIERTTKETTITVAVEMEAAASPAADAVDVQTTVPFLDHMLHAMAFHGGFALEVRASGDTEVDDHHLVEDTGIVVGQCLQRIAEQQPLRRFGSASVPMDDALADVVIDAGGRPYCHYQATFSQQRVGTFDVALVREFFVALAVNARLNLHAVARHGVNAHHIIEALYKALGRALAQAFEPAAMVRSTKGAVD